MRLYHLSLILGPFCMAMILGCSQTESLSTSTTQETTEKKEEPKPAAETKKVPVGKNLFLEIQGEQRRVRINAEVCLREGLLEQLMTKKRAKEHESILAADIDARELHFALTLTGAESGKPVQFRPKLVAPKGTTIKIILEYQDQGKTVRVPAQKWIRNLKNKKELPSDWVFAGSILIPDPFDKNKKPFYGANEGDIITVVNFESSCLDVPFLSTKDNDELTFEANTPLIPAKGTPVTVILEPVIEKKKQ